MIKLAPNLSLPTDVVTQTIALLAKRRAGKSYAARRLTEQLAKARQQVVIADPKGDWWGLRSSADGKGPGLPIVILGGERGDAPLEPGGGEIVAKLVVEERVSVLLDLSLLRKHAVATFMTDFLEALYRMKARELYRTPMMLVIDEADAIAPQRPMKGEERMLGAAEDIVRRGGQRGIGCTLISQRAAVVNKNVLTQTQVLVALRTIAPQDLDALNAWIDVHGSEEQRRTLMESLPALPVGDAWFWSPGWPDVDGIFERVSVLPIETFDSGATPRPGEKRREPKTVAEVDLEALKRQMAETIARAKADDPKELKRKVAELEKQLKAKPTAAVSQDAIDAAVGTALAARDKHWKAEVGKLEKAVKERTGRLAKIEQLAHLNGEAAVKTAEPPAASRWGDRHGPPVSPPHPRLSRPKAPARTAEPAGDLGKGETAVLTAIAQHESGVSREQLTVLTGYKRSSRDTYLQRLKSRGLIEDAGGAIAATGEGFASLGDDFEPLPTGDRLREYWLDRLDAGEQRILRLLCDAHPDAVDREKISEATEYKRSSRDTYLQKLKSRKLVVDEGRGLVRASDLLFD